MLGLLLSRAGVDVIVLEKHADFLRDFRGDTVHPSTLEQERVLRRTLGGRPPGARVAHLLFTRLPVLRRIPARVIGLGFRPERVAC
jgi:2-polyprenyl-6-methoxyphenol hydroxylase-like FAD-dependent oxidoreductase